MKIVAISGKIGTGKTTLAREIRNAFSFPAMVAFGDYVKDEVANFLELDRMRFNTQEGKLTPLPRHAIDILEGFLGRPLTNELLYRDAMQLYGTQYRRSQDPDYWVKRAVWAIERLHTQRHDICIIHDLRFPNEAEMLRNLKAYTVRLNPHPHWKPGEHANHLSEVALDAYTHWDMVFNPAHNGTKEVAASVLAYMSLFPRSVSFMRFPVMEGSV